MKYCVQVHLHVLHVHACTSNEQTSVINVHVHVQCICEIAYRFLVQEGGVDFVRPLPQVVLLGLCVLLGHQVEELQEHNTQ